MASEEYYRATNATGGVESPILLLEITHADLVMPIRVVSDTRDVVHEQHVFTAMAFSATFPDDISSGQPSAKLSIDNVGRELTSWLEATAGGKGAEVRMIQIMRSAPEVVEGEVTLELSDLQVDSFEVSGTLGFVDLLNLPGVPMKYTPEIAPGLY